MIVPRYIVGFSGHRHLHDVAKIREPLRECLSELAEKARAVGGVLEFFSGIAYGADLVAVEVARELGLAVHLILPKPVRCSATGEVRKDAGFAADFWDAPDPDAPKIFREQDWEFAWRQIQEAESGRSGGTLRIVHGCHTEPECYYDTGMQILEACDVFVVVWDGDAAQGLGGTAQLVERARLEHPPRPLLILDAATGAVTWEHGDVFASPKEEQLQRIDQLNALLSQSSPATPQSTADILSSLDQFAQKTSHRFRHRAVEALCCQGLASIVGAAAILLPRHGPQTSVTLFVLAVLEMILVLRALTLTIVQTRRQTHQLWMRSRFGAELARGASSAVYFVDPLGRHFAWRVPVWRRFALSFAFLSLPKGSERSNSWQDRREAYLKNRLLDQLQFFKGHQRSADAAWRWVHAVGRWATLLAPVAVLIAICAKGWFMFHPLDPNHSFNWASFATDLMVRFLPIVIPLIAGMAAGVSATLDLTRRTVRYKEMESLLQTRASQLQATKTESDARRIVQATEDILLDELIEWRLAERHGGLH